jgi:peptidoglycan/LPS O-acetylase OafA/YrhL
MTSMLPARDSRSVSRLTTVDCLRGLAASAVVWFHLTNGNPSFHAPAWLKASGRYGWLGVEAFFVISGFVIPYALRKADYRLRDYRPFLCRRIVRLDPPYFASMAIAVVLAYASTLVPGFRGEPPSYSAAQILSHVAYLNNLLGFNAVIVVYWSLALEFQYYLLMGVLFPFVGHNNPRVRAATFIALAGLAVVMRNPLLVFSWFFLFLLGIMAFYYRERMVNAGWYAVGVALAGASVWATQGTATAVVAVASSLVIAFVELRSAPLQFLGEISYSLYLIHVPIAGRVINAGTHMSLGPAGMTLVVVSAFGVAIGSAYAFNRLIERPARIWAERIRYGGRAFHPSEAQAIAPGGSVAA